MEKTINPDIWLDDSDNIILVNPYDEGKKYDTGISIFSYKN
jgi:hypothetical protein